MGNYTQLWNQEFQRNTQGLKDFNLCLEIGSFEGLTSNYIIDNLLNVEGKLICIDPLSDVYLNDNLNENDIHKNQVDFSYFKNQYERFSNNTKNHLESGKLILYRNLSKDVFGELIEKYENSIDFIYVDGDHRASSVYIDGLNSLKLCKIGGYILFDDYQWGDPNDKEFTKLGIDKFLKEYEKNIEVISINYQVLIKKKS